ncbi:purine/pyrimidine permease [Melghirimyces algeriensis]|uniref:Xanthine/uracil permease n=1 Tax=Melghirimyces algeriensis TaxID=910412 RepID=A0A521EJ22_9BACL|nr:purine/pyrimidine permease [Melghirimyces algeriensis]SMO83918.1 Xanthine/uracil permease [Melghirimyces algeriensis]
MKSSMPSRQTAAGSVQWFVFLVSNTVAMPIIIGQVFQLSPEEVAGLMQRAFLVIGVASFLQGWLGHRLPIADGPAGVWLGVFVITGETAIRQGQEPLEALQLLQGGMLVAGFFLALLGVFRLLRRMQNLFTPFITGVYLLLLVIQLSGVLLKGMLGAGGSDIRLNSETAVISLGVLFLILFLSFRGKGSWKNYAVLIGIAIGWLAVTVLGENQAVGAKGAGVAPDVFAWGEPRWDAGILLSGLLIGLVLVSNILASVSAVGQVVGASEKNTRPGLNRSGMIAGVATVLSALFSTVGSVPLSNSAGFIQIIGQRARRPFLIGSFLMGVVAFIPPVMMWLATIPSPVTHAALAASFTGIAGIAVRNLTRQPLDERRITILGLALISGTGVMVLPASFFQSLPAVLQFVGGNGLLTGTMVAMVLEQVWRSDGERTRRKRKRA